MKLKHWALPAAAVVLIAVIIALSWERDKPLYGNDEASIMETLQSLDSYKGSEITLLAIRDEGDARIVPLLAGGRPGYAAFRRGEDGNYTFQSAGTQGGGSFATFLVHAIPGEMLLVMNAANDIAKMQVTVNGQLIEQTFPARRAGAAWLLLPDSGDGGYTYRNYRYYDEDGELIGENG